MKDPSIVFAADANNTSSDEIAAINNTVADINTATTTARGISQFDSNQLEMMKLIYLNINDSIKLLDEIVCSCLDSKVQHEAVEFIQETVHMDVASCSFIVKVSKDDLFINQRNINQINIKLTLHATIMNIILP